MAAFNSLLSRKEEIAENYAFCLDAITDTSAYQARLDAINRECGELSTLINALLQKGSKLVCADESRGFVKDMPKEKTE